MEKRNKLGASRRRESSWAIAKILRAIESIWLIKGSRD